MRYRLLLNATFAPIVVDRYLRWVRNDGHFIDCDTDVDCKSVESQKEGDRDLKCGALFGIDTARGGYTEEVRREDKRQEGFSIPFVYVCVCVCVCVCRLSPMCSGVVMGCT